MKNKRYTFWYWVIAIVITLAAVVYQRTTGPTYPKRVEATVNGQPYKLKLVRSLALDDRSAVKLNISDTTVSAKLYYRRFPTNDAYQTVDFTYEVKPVHSFVMNKIFNVTEEKGYFAEVPHQPAAGKIQYYFEITDDQGTKTYLKEQPVVIRYKGTVPLYVLIPHVFAMFIAMFLSNLAGAMAVRKHPRYKFHAKLTLILLTIGGLILGPLVQKFAFGQLWTGIPFGWDLTDNKTLIGFMFWLFAVWQNRRAEKPGWVILASVVLLAIYSIPHSMFGSELNYDTGKVVTGWIMPFIPFL
jgi:hypothetical protein